MKDVAGYTRITPHQRIAAIHKYLENVRKSDEAQRVLGEWGLRVDQDIIDLKARQLQNETICFGNTTVQPRNADWNGDCGRNKLTGPVDMCNWLLFYTDRDTNNAKEFAKTMCSLGGVMGCRINQPKAIKLPDDRNETYMQMCKEHLDRNVQVRYYNLFINPILAFKPFHKVSFLSMITSIFLNTFYGKIENSKCLFLPAQSFELKTEFSSRKLLKQGLKTLYLLIPLNVN